MDEVRSTASFLAKDICVNRTTSLFRVAIASKSQLDYCSSRQVRREGGVLHLMHALLDHLHAPIEVGDRVNKLGGTHASISYN